MRYILIDECSTTSKVDKITADILYEVVAGILTIVDTTTVMECLEVDNYHQPIWVKISKREML